MEVRVEGNGGGSTEIQLDYASVISELENALQTLNTLSLQFTGDSACGQNKLNYTDQWLERENNLQTIFSQYIEIVRKNLDDTKLSIALLKNQDEAIVRK